MTYSAATTLEGPSRGSPDVFRAILAGRTGFSQDPYPYLEELYRLCHLHGFRAEVLAFQSWHETAQYDGLPWSSDAWSVHNPAGIGVTTNAERKKYDFHDGKTAAGVHVARMWIYVHGPASMPADLAPYWAMSPRQKEAIATAGGKCVTLGDLNGKWAWPGTTYAQMIAEIANRYADRFMDLYTPAPSSPQETPRMALTVKKRMVPTTNRNHPNTLLNADGDLYIMVHETGNTGAGTGARMHADFVMNGGGSSSVAFHLTVDQTEAYQMYPLKYIGYHASDGCNSRAEDWGCFRSVAIETCVNDGNRYKDATRRNLAELIVMILSGDPQIDFGGIDHRRFSADRIRTHHDAAYDKKWCPTYMLNEGYMPTLRTQVRAKLSGVTPAPVAGFALGDTVEVTEALNLRGGWGTSHAILGTLPPGTRGTVIADDVGAFTHVNDGYTWLNISTPLQPGWVAVDWLKKVEAPKPPPPAVEYAPRVIIPELAALGPQDRDTAAKMVLKNGIHFITVWDEIEATETAVNLQFAYKDAKKTEADSPAGTRRWVSYLFQADDKDWYYYDERGNRLIASQWKRIQD